MKNEIDANSEVKINIIYVSFLVLGLVLITN